MKTSQVKSIASSIVNHNAAPYVADLRHGKFAPKVAQTPLNSMWFAMQPVMNKLIDLVQSVRANNTLDLISK